MHLKRIIENSKPRNSRTYNVPWGVFVMTIHWDFVTVIRYECKLILSLFVQLPHEHEHKTCICACVFLLLVVRELIILPSRKAPWHSNESISVYVTIGPRKHNIRISTGSDNRSGWLEFYHSHSKCRVPCRAALATSEYIFYAD